MRGVKRIAAALLAALLVLSLAACGTQKTGLRLYYPADLSAKHKSVGGSDAITSVLVDWKKVTGTTGAVSSRRSTSWNCCWAGARQAASPAPYP